MRAWSSKSIIDFCVTKITIFDGTRFYALHKTRKKEIDTSLRSSDLITKLVTHINITNSVNELMRAHVSVAFPV